MSLDIEKLRTLLDLLAEKDVAELEHEENGVKLRISRGPRVVAAAPVAFASPAAQSVLPPSVMPGVAAAGSPAAGPAAAAAAAADGGDEVDVTSPFVGTFYRSPTPDAPSFVEV